MPRLVIKDRSVVPVGGMVRYRDPDEGFVIAHPYYDWCKAWAADERKRRGLALPWNWDDVFDAGVCAATPQACVEVPDAPETAPGSRWHAQLLHFGASMVAWAKSGFAVVDGETYVARLEQCTGTPATPRCPQFTTFAGTGIVKCGSCGCTSLKLWLGGTNKCPLGKW